MYRGIKRILDVFLGMIGVTLCCPIYILIKMAYLLSGDHGPVIYTQKRIGKGGKSFPIYKFRTMVVDADDRLAELLQESRYRQEWEVYQKFSHDPRITKVGAILRKTSLDEFPQVFNVLKGDMSMVGPRPLVEGELEMHGGDKKYWNVKPGITGWWACNGRSDIKYKKRLELEYYYIENCSLYLDLLCISIIS